MFGFLKPTYLDKVKELCAKVYEGTWDQKLFQPYEKKDQVKPWVDRRDAVVLDKLEGLPTKKLQYYANFLLRHIEMEYKALIKDADKRALPTKNGQDFYDVLTNAYGLYQKAMQGGDVDLEQLVTDLRQMYDFILAENNAYNNLIFKGLSSTQFFRSQFDDSKYRDLLVRNIESFGQVVKNSHSSNDPKYIETLKLSAVFLETSYVDLEVLDSEAKKDSFFSTLKNLFGSNESCSVTRFKDNVLEQNIEPAEIIDWVVKKSGRHVSDRSCCILTLASNRTKPCQFTGSYEYSDGVSPPIFLCGIHRHEALSKIYLEKLRIKESNPEEQQPLLEKKKKE